MKVLTVVFGVVVVVGSSILPSAAQQNMRRDIPKAGMASCIFQDTPKEICFSVDESKFVDKQGPNSGGNGFCNTRAGKTYCTEVDVSKYVNRKQPGKISCNYNSRLRVWQLMQGQNTISGVASAAASASSSGRVLFQSAEKAECVTAGDIFISQMAAKGFYFGWNIKTTEVKN